MFLVFLFVVQTGFSQNKPRCATNIPISEKDRLRKSLFEQKISEHIDKQKANLRLAENSIIRIPVVVHVIHNQSNNAIAGNNIPDEQIFSQIKVLNEDYRKKVGTMGWNTNPVGADMEIEFALASIDPDGNPSNGITRTYNSTPYFDLINDRYKLSSLAYWDSNKYLNIWVASYDNNYIGYGEFPGGAIDGLEGEDSDELIDGVFIDNLVFGSNSGLNTSGLYRFGRTTTHEIGHWFGLIHTWGDSFCGDDYCNDTPQTESSNLATTCKVKYSNCSGTKTLNMIENYMDYSPDTCMNIFTNNQKQRVRAVLTLSKRRARLIKNAEFQLPKADKLTVYLYPNPTTNDNIQLQVMLPDFQDITVEILDILGKTVYTKTYLDYPSTILKLTETNLRGGMYFVRVSSKNESVITRLVVI